MKKVIPLTTEIAIRQHTKKIVLENILRILKETEEKRKVSAQEREATRKWEKYSKGGGTGVTAFNYLDDMTTNITQMLEILSNDRVDNAAYRAMIGQWAMVISQRGQGYLGEVIDYLDDMIYFPINSEEFGQIYAFWAALIKRDPSENLELTKHVMSLYAKRNESLSEFLVDSLNPLDPMNLLFYALAPLTGGASLALLGLKKGAKEIAEQSGKQLAKAAAKKKMAQETADRLAKTQARKIAQKDAAESITKRTATFEGAIEDDVFFEELVELAGEKLTKTRKKYIVAGGRTLPKIKLESLPGDWSNQLSKGFKDTFEAIDLDDAATFGTPGQYTSHLKKKIKDSMGESMKADNGIHLDKLVDAVFDNNNVKAYIDDVFFIADRKVARRVGRFNLLGRELGIPEPVAKFGQRVSAVFTGAPVSATYKKTLTNFGMDDAAAELLEKRLKDNIELTARRRIDLEGQLTKQIDDMSPLDAADALDAAEKELDNVVTERILAQRGNIEVTPDIDDLITKGIKEEKEKLVGATKKLLEKGEIGPTDLDNWNYLQDMARNSAPTYKEYSKSASKYSIRKLGGKAFKPISESIENATAKMTLMGRDDLLKIADDATDIDDVFTKLGIDDTIRTYYKNLIDLGDEQINDVLKGQLSTLRQRARSEVERIDIFEALDDSGLEVLKKADGSYDMKLIEELQDDMIEVVKNNGITNSPFYNPKHLLSYHYRVTAGRQLLGAAGQTIFGKGRFPDEDAIAADPEMAVSPEEIQAVGEESTNKLEELKRALQQVSLNATLSLEESLKEQQKIIDQIEAEMKAETADQPAMTKTGEVIPDDDFDRQALQDAYDEAEAAATDLGSIVGWVEYYDRSTKGLTELAKTGGNEKIDQMAAYLTDEDLRAETYQDISKINFIDTWGLEWFAKTFSGRECLGVELTGDQLDWMVDLLVSVLKSINGGAKKSEVEGILYFEGARVDSDEASWISTPFEKGQILEMRQSINGMLNAYPLNQVKFPKYYQQWESVIGMKSQLAINREQQKEELEAIRDDVEELKKPVKKAPVMSTGKAKYSKSQKEWIKNKRAKQKKSYGKKRVDESFMIKEAAIRKLIRKQLINELKKKD